MSRRLRTALILLAAGTGTAAAQDPVAPTRPVGVDEAQTTRRVTGARSLESLHAGFSRSEISESGEVLLYLIDDVRVQAGDLFLRADNAVVWFAREAADALSEAIGTKPAGEAPPESRPTPPGALFEIPAAVKDLVREIYLDGVVLVLQGDEVTRADAAYFDFERDRGLIVDARTSFPFNSKEGTTRLYIRADELRVLATDRFEAVGVRATTCSFGHPHYHVSSDYMELWRSRTPPRKRLRRAGNSLLAESRPSGQPGLRYTASGNVLRYGDTPVFWLPDLAGEGGSGGGGSTKYLRDIRGGSSSEFGLHGGVTIGDDLVDDRGDIWAEWGLLLDYRSKRGFGTGVDFAYDREDSFGFVHGYYQRDHGEDRLYGRPEDDDRGRISAQHRQKLPWEVQLDLELNYFSDRGFYPTYYEEEFKSEKPPETYAYLKKTFDRSAVTALLSTRLHDFDSTTEYKPRIDYTLLYEPIAEPFGNPLYFTTRAEVANLKRKDDDLLAIPNRSTTRIDVDNLLEYPFEVGPVTATPFAGLRASYFGEDVYGREDRVRDGFTYGVELASQAWRTFDASGGLFGLDGIRHVVRPSIEYRRTTGVDLGSSDLVRYDEVDLYADREEVAFSLRNLFQTVRKRQDGPAVDEFLDLDFRLSYFPNAERDNLSEPWGPLIGDHVVRFSDRLQLLSDFEYDLQGGGFDLWNIAVGYTPSADLQVFAGVRNFEESYGLMFGQINWRVTEKWLTRLYGSYNYERGKSSDYEIGLVRIGHDFVFEVFVRFDFGEDDRSLRVALTPRAWFNPTIDAARRLGREPRLSTLGSELHR